MSTDYFVNLVVDDDAGRVVFWHRSEHVDLTEMAVLWGQSIGRMWGTHSECWFVNRLGAKQIYPRVDPSILDAGTNEQSQWRES